MVISSGRRALVILLYYSLSRQSFSISWAFFLFRPYDYYEVYSAAHPNCYGYPCDSVIYLRFSNGTMHKNFGGYYVIDGIEERLCTSHPKNTDKCKTAQSKGFPLPTDLSLGTPRYRHLNKPIWIQTELYTPNTIITGQRSPFDVFLKVAVCSTVRVCMSR